MFRNVNVYFKNFQRILVQMIVCGYFNPILTLKGTLNFKLK